MHTPWQQGAEWPGDPASRRGPVRSGRLGGLGGRGDLRWQGGGLDLGPTLKRVPATEGEEAVGECACGDDGGRRPEGEGKRERGGGGWGGEMAMANNIIIISTTMATAPVYQNPHGRYLYLRLLPLLPLQHV